jgi:dihydroorotate dehydrogenase
VCIGTGNFTDPRIPVRIMEELRAYLEQRGHASIREIVGKANVGFANSFQHGGDEG